MRRAALAGAAVAVVVAGLAVHRLAPEGVVADAAGDVLYAVLAYLLAALAAPRARVVVVAAVAFAWCAAVELLQLTPLPALAARAFPPSVLVLGTTFVATDLLWYAAGAAAAAVADRVARVLRGPGRHPTGAPASR